MLCGALALLVVCVAAPGAALATTSADDQAVEGVRGEADALMREGKFEAALAKMDQAMALHPRATRGALARLHMQRGVVLVLLDRPTQARTAFNLAVCYDPGVDPKTLDLSPTTARIFDDARGDPCPTLPGGPEGGVGQAEGGSPWPAVLMASGAVLIAGGSVLGVLALQAEDDVADAYQVDAQRLRDRANNLALGADVALFTGAAVVTTGLVLWLMADDPDAEGSARLAPLPLDGPGVSLAFSF